MKLQVQGREAYAYTGGKPFDRALPCVVFIHGASHDHSGWTLLARWFAHHGHGVLAVDLPGHMRSAGPLLPDVEALAGWIWALLDAAGVERAALVGHSMGSLIALQAAALAPDRTTHLALISASYPMKVSDALLATAREAPQRAMAMVNAWSIGAHASKPRDLPGDDDPGPGGPDDAAARRARHHCCAEGPCRGYLQRAPPAGRSPRRHARGAARRPDLKIRF